VTCAQTGLRQQRFKAKTEFGHGLASTDFSLTPLLWLGVNDA
jgi:hypothetical protein